MQNEDVVTIGLTEQSHGVLQRLKDEQAFPEMVDGYRFAIALAINRSLIAQEQTRMTTIFNVGTLDPDGTIRNMISELFPEMPNPYSVAQRLAEAGIAELGRIRGASDIRFGPLVRDLMSAGQTD